MTGRVEGKVALVTGAARGQGRAHAVQLAAQGADLIITDLCEPIPHVAYPSPTLEDLEETARLVREQGRKVVAVKADVRDREAMAAAIKTGVEELGKLDVVVANAGVMVMTSWKDQTPEIWDLTIGTNLTGVWNTAQLAAPYLVENGGGSIVLISSAAGIKASPFVASYVASKFGVKGIMHALAAELAEHKVRVNSIHPCGVDTPMVAGEMMMEVIAPLYQASPRLAPMGMNLLDVGMVEPEDVSQAVLYLASDESRYVTSLEMTVDAGITNF